MNYENTIEGFCQYLVEKYPDENEQAIAANLIRIYRYLLSDDILSDFTYDEPDEAYKSLDLYIDFYNAIKKTNYMSCKNAYNTIVEPYRNMSSRKIRKAFEDFMNQPVSKVDNSYSLSTFIKVWSCGYEYYNCAFVVKELTNESVVVEKVVDFCNDIMNGPIPEEIEVFLIGLD